MPVSRWRSSDESAAEPHDLGEIRETLEELREALKRFGAPVSPLGHPGGKLNETNAVAAREGERPRNPDGSPPVSRRGPEGFYAPVLVASADADGDSLEEADPVFARMHERLSTLAQTIGQDAESLSAQATRIESLLAHESRPVRFGVLLERLASLERCVAEMVDLLSATCPGAGSASLEAEVKKLRALIGPPNESTKEAADRLEIRFDRLDATGEERFESLDAKLVALDGALTEIRWSLANRPGVERLERKVADLCRKVDSLLERGVGDPPERSFDELVAKIDRSRDEMARIAHETVDSALPKSDEQRIEAAAERMWSGLDEARGPPRVDPTLRSVEGAKPSAMDRLPGPCAPFRVVEAPAPGLGQFLRRTLAFVSAIVIVGLTAWLLLGYGPPSGAPLRMLDAISADLD